VIIVRLKNDAQSYIYGARNTRADGGKNRAASRQLLQSEIISKNTIQKPCFIFK